jgi:hypothetical protein
MKIFRLVQVLIDGACNYKGGIDPGMWVLDHFQKRCFEPRGWINWTWCDWIRSVLLPLVRLDALLVAPVKELFRTRFRYRRQAASNFLAGCRDSSDYVCAFGAETPEAARCSLEATSPTPAKSFCFQLEQ